MFLESITSNIISKALDVSSYNHQLIATNIANVGIKGYAASHLKFDNVMNELREQIQTGSDDSSLSSSLENIGTDLSSYTVTDLQEVSIDKEMLSLTENTLRYEALLRARSELGDILKIAISGGRV